MGEITFRVERFQPDIDIPSDIALMHLGVRRWQEENGQNSFPDIEDSQVDLGDIQGSYIDSGGNFFVAHDAIDHGMLGFVGLRRAADGHGIIKRLAVIPERQREGIGSALVQEAVEWARANDFSRLTLTTGTGEKARPLYEKFGFEVIGYIKPLDDWLMRLKLVS